MVKRVVRWSLALVLSTAGVLVLWAGPASAHAVVTSASPQQGSVVPSAPATIVLKFNEPVAVVPGRTQVVGPDGKRLNDGDAQAINGGMSITLRATDRPLGTYLVSWRVISADSHPIAGSFLFSVGAPSASAPKPVEAGTDPVVQGATLAMKYTGYLGVVLVIGPLLMLTWWYPRRLSRRSLTVPVRIGLAAIAVSALGALWLQAPASSGAGVFDVSGTELKQVLLNSFGLVMVARLLVVAATAVLLRWVRRRPGRAVGALLLVLGAAGLVTWPLTGHPAASPQAAMLVLADVVHLAAMGLWVGGLIALLVLLRRVDGRELRVILPAWSRWALIAVYWLVAAGVLQAVVQLGGWDELTGTSYGKLLLVKAGLVTLVLTVAVFSRRLVQRGGPAATHGLRRTVGAEIGIAVVVLAASSVLVQTNPGRTVDIEAVAAEKAKGFVTTLDSPLYAVQFEVYPAKVGEYNSMHAFVYTPDGRPLEVKEWKVTAALPEQGIEPIINEVATLGTNQGLGNLAFPIAGKWQLSLTLRVSEIDQATVTTTIPIS